MGLYKLPVRYEHDPRMNPQKILVLGAGRSSSVLIDFLLDHASDNQWLVTVGDMDLSLARDRVNGHPHGVALAFDITHPEQKREVAHFDLVISMLPASFHLIVAELCAAAGINMLTASYVSDEIKALSETFEKNGAGLIMEMGLDPGIDHMSAMKVLDRIKGAGAELRTFETFTGGLLAPSNDDNPWKYKFTWNPRNVVLAGQGYVKFLQEGKYKYIPYQKLFKRTEVIHIPEHGYFEGYANRDSLKYLDAYKLRGIQTLYRGTLRRTGFCRAWDIFVQLGATDDTFQMQNVSEMTHRQFINSFLSYNPNDSVELKLAHYMNLDMESEEMYKLKWLGMFEEELVGLDKGSPAQVLEHILKKKWTIQPDDKDMIVMWHKFEYVEDGKLKKLQSYMAVEGEDAIHTAMAKTVGLPLAVTAKLILQGKLVVSGVQIPTERSVYEPVLAELENHGINFTELETN
ncbi:saccharopine dehydrogenase NADP-binding domain-containing protein [Reichenbachiella agarivorans]|uniref:Saccharopine dehydrogenase NADP-binding domain-containing protein n=1 Tax=Reichenbachiella agarivorans TaxID=2979464 RepID=A0ABY6CR52_9BACT|nr:saccharopine dehydrogenase C-terminal domain-containing protein [Reichenbachiella agarivorans]UXP32992.1 saccharopine dehydrogenase NADP-binding domain-containing protein [Reichenbachiella agarivorans]